MFSATFAGFGYRELDLAADLLKAYANNPPTWMWHWDDLNVGMNENSGMVFLYSEENCQTAVLEDGKLVEWFTCPECGNEGTDVVLDPITGQCSNTHKE